MFLFDNENRGVKLKGNITFGIDLGVDSLKAAYAYEVAPGEFAYGKLAYSFFDDMFPSYAYCSEDNDEWTFGEDIFAGNKDYERIVKIKDLICLYDGTETSPYCNAKYRYPKFRPRFIEKGEKVFTEVTTFTSKYSPREVCEQFFSYYFAEYFATSTAGLMEVYPDLTLQQIRTARCLIVIPDNAIDEYAGELVRLISKTSTLSTKEKGYKTRRVSEAVALFAVAEGKLADMERALVVDIGETGMSLSVVDGINLEEYITVRDEGGDDYDQDVYRYVKQEIQKKHGENENLGTYFQLFNLELRIKNAKASFLTPLWAKTRIEVESATTEMIPLTREAFLAATEGTTNKICKEVLAAAKKAAVKKVILTGGAAQTFGLLSRMQEMAPRMAIVTYGTERRKANNPYDIFDSGLKFAPSVGAALFATKQYRSRSKTPKSYGIKTVDDNNKPVYSRVILKNTPLPAAATRTFYTIGIVTKSITTDIYSTDSLDAEIDLYDEETIEKCVKNGTLALKDKGCHAWFTKEVPKNYPIDIKISIDADGVGEVHAYDGRNPLVELRWEGKKFSTSSNN